MIEKNQEPIYNFNVKGLKVSITGGAAISFYTIYNLPVPEFIGRDDMDFIKSNLVEAYAALKRIKSRGAVKSSDLEMSIKRIGCRLNVTCFTIRNAATGVGDSVDGALGCMDNNEDDRVSSYTSEKLSRYNPFYSLKAPEPEGEEYGFRMQLKYGLNWQEKINGNEKIKKLSKVVQDERKRN